MSVAWIDGQWGPAAQLALPLNDRGLQLADGLFETVLIAGGRPQLLDAHLQRWQRSAALLGMAAPPEHALLEPLLAEAIARAQLGNGNGALRLNWSRGHQQGRGIGLPEGPALPEQHRFWLELTPTTPTFSPLTAIVSRQERRNAASLLSQCKTFAYGQAIQARREAQRARADDALLLNGNGELCCGSTANLLIRRRGTWLTPPLASGCLPGVMRGRLLQLGLAHEQRLEASPEPGDQWLLINSLSCRPLRSLDGQRLEPWGDAEPLWRSLL